MKIVRPEFTVEADLAYRGVDICRAIESAARTAYRSEGKITADSYRKLLPKLIGSGHESTLEHQVITVRFVCDRGVSHELVRHRLAAYTQESTRYCNYSQDKFDNEIQLIPMMEGLNEQQVERRKELYRHIESVYLAELREGIKPQQARDNLPTCLRTEIVMTANIREWRHVLRLRTSRQAHPQMRALMMPLLREFQRHIPILFDDIQPEENRMNRPWPISPENYDTCINQLFPLWLKERDGIVVYQNHLLDSSHLGDTTFLPARYWAEDNQLHDAPDEYRPHGGLPSYRQQRVDHVKLEEFGGDVQRALCCFRKETT